MKIARVKHHVEGGKPVFKIDGEVRDVPFAMVAGMDDNLKNMNLQRYFIRRSKKTKSMSLGKRFK